MPALPVKVSEAWENREGTIIFTTVGQDGYPNTIYALCVAKYTEELIVVANNYFSKTLENILSGSKGSILFMTKDGTAYQIKGSISYHQDGPIFEDMKTWNPKERPGLAAAALRVEEVYQGAAKLL